LWSDGCGFRGHVLAVYYATVLPSFEPIIHLRGRDDTPPTLLPWSLKLASWFSAHPEALEHFVSPLEIHVHDTARWEASSSDAEAVTLLQGQRVKVVFKWPKLAPMVEAIAQLEALIIDELVLDGCRDLADEASMEYTVNLFRHMRIRKLSIHDFPSAPRRGQRHLQRKLAALPLITTLWLSDVSFQTYQGDSRLRKQRNPYRSFLHAFVGLRTLTVQLPCAGHAAFIDHVPVSALRRLHVGVPDLSDEHLRAFATRLPVPMVYLDDPQPPAQPPAEEVRIACSGRLAMLMMAQ
jgi:hypothetical protein